jgi:hypothetical protein
MNTAAILLTLAGLGGLVVASFPLRGIPRPPTWLALGHGAVAAAGLITLIYYVLTSTVTTMVLAATGLLVLAALGGFALFAGFHLRERPLPIPLVLGHGLAALAGVVLLWLSILRVV